MSKKHNLKAVLVKLRSWAESSGDEILDAHLNELENEINTTSDADEDDEGGNSPSEPPDLP